MQEKNRIVWIDWAKVILIYLMVVGHALPCKWENQVIYAFHMPAFFIISGFLLKLNKNKDTKSMILKKRNGFQLNYKKCKEYIFLT